jgi:hypothetical protein
MLALISPAKKLNFESDPTTSDYTLPDLLDDTEVLVAAALKLTREKLAQTMKLSTQLAELNFQRYKDFSTPFNLGNAKQAALAFNGDTYAGLQAETFKKSDLDFAQKHLRILSGLYGLLRPLDLIQPYRLEMGAKFQPPCHTDLYDFWSSRITEKLNETLDKQKNPTVINLASTEYFKSVKTKHLCGSVITPVFKEIKEGQSRIIGTFAKQARGSMARFIITNRVSDPDCLKAFDTNGYKYRDDLSDGATWTFTRLQPAPAS